MPLYSPEELKMKKLTGMLAALACSLQLHAQAADEPALEVKVEFAAEINGKTFVCGQTYPQIGVTASTITPSDFRLFVSEMKLLTRDGRQVPLQLEQDGRWQHEDLALLDFENGTGPCRNGTAGTHTAVRGRAPQADYVGVEFVVGVPFRLNHNDATVAPSPLNVSGMFWNWQGGYKFVKFDTHSSGLPDAGAGTDRRPAPGFAVHLGSTQCTPAGPGQPSGGCRQSNRMTIRFDRFDLQRGVVVADIGHVLAKANVDVNQEKTPPGCMSALKDGDCPPVMKAFGLPYEDRPAQPQVFLSARQP